MDIGGVEDSGKGKQSGVAFMMAVLDSSAIATAHGSFCKDGDLGSDDDDSLVSIASSASTRNANNLSGVRCGNN